MQVLRLVLFVLLPIIKLIKVNHSVVSGEFSFIHDLTVALLSGLCVYALLLLVLLGFRTLELSVTIFIGGHEVVDLELVLGIHVGRDRHHSLLLVIGRALDLTQAKLAMTVADKLVGCFPLLSPIAWGGQGGKRSITTEHHIARSCAGRLTSLACTILIWSLVLVNAEEKFASWGSSTLTVNGRGSYLWEPITQASILLELRVMAAMAQGNSFVGFLVTCKELLW